MRAGLEGGEAGVGDPLAQALGTVCRERGSVWPMPMTC
jgi:hypothetical protein